MKKEVAVGTVVQETQRGNDACHPRWERTRRAELFERYGALRAQGTSQRQAAQLLNVPRSTLQAWQAYQESLDESPAVVAFFHSPAGLAFLHRLVLAFHLVCVEVGACGIRLVCLLLTLTGLDRFVAASYGPTFKGTKRTWGIFLRRVLYPSPHARRGIPIGGGFWQKVLAMSGHQRLCMAS